RGGHRGSESKDDDGGGLRRGVRQGRPSVHVPEEAITSYTREPSYMFLAAEWNRSTVSERAYLLAMLFGREFEVEANDFSLQIAGLAMMMLEPDGSHALIARRRPRRGGPRRDANRIGGLRGHRFISNRPGGTATITDERPIIDEDAAIDSAFFGSHAGRSCYARAHRGGWVLVVRQAVAQCEPPVM